MSTRAELRAEKKPRRPLLRSFRFWIPVGILLLLIILAVAGLLVGKPIYDRAMAARASLVQAMPLATQAKNQILAGDSEGAAATAEKLSALTADAREQTDDGMWKSLEWVPFIGPNLHAVRTAAAVTDDLVTGAVAPATSLSLKALTPVNGAINLDAITAMQSTVTQAADTIDKASSDLDAIDEGSLIPQVDQAVAELTGAVDELKPLVGPARDILGVLPAALGADGPRTYLLMFQGTSEARSLGGNPAAFILMNAENGRLTIVQQVSSIDFQQARRNPVVPLDPSAEAIYGDKIGRYTPDLTMIPDFPAATDILRGWWESEDLPEYDGAISLDPVALSYLLAATGPVTLPTGDVLTAESAVPLLLNEVYFQYDDPFEQDAFFATAAASVFGKVTAGAFSPVSFLSALTKATEEGRLLYRSYDSQETQLMASSRLSGVMPSDDDTSTIVGVFLNDNTASKKSYYLDMAITLCRSGTSVDGAVTLSSSLSEAQANELPRYVAGPYFAPRDISTYVVLYGAEDSTFADVTIDGAPATILASGVHLGRPVIKVQVLNHASDAHTISFRLDDGVSANSKLSAWHTPMTRDTMVSVKPSCDQ